MGRISRWAIMGAVVALVAAAVPAISASAPAGATVITVTTRDDGNGPGTLRSAIAAATAAGGDEIVLQADEFYGLTCEAGGVLAHGGTPLTITGNGATIIQLCPDTTVLEQNGSGTLELVDVTIMGGGGLLAGGVMALGDVVLTGSTVQQNRATGAPGAGGLLVAGDLTMTDSAVEDNQAPNGVGGADVEGSATITRSAFQGNSGAAGGGLAVTGPATIDDGTFGGNQATDTAGGGITGGTVTVTDSLFSANAAATGGGAIAAASADVSTSSFAGNTARWAGGAVFAQTLTLSGSSVYLNSVTGDAADPLYRGGGGVAAMTALTLKSSGITDNSAALGANVWVGTVPAGTAIATQLSGPKGGGTNCFPTAAPDASGAPLTSLGHNYVSDTSCFAPGGSTDQVVPGGDPKLADAADNGGPTPTRMPQAGSPLIDVIPADVCVAAGLVEQRGFARLQGPACDIGPVEVEVVEPRFTG